MIYTTVAILSSALLFASASPQFGGNRQRPFGASPSPAPLQAQTASADLPLQQQQPQLQQQQLQQQRISTTNTNGYIGILRQEHEDQFDGSFKYAFETENGIAQQAVGSLRSIGAEQPTQVIQGSYSYTSPEGQVITINYIADEEGYKPQGDSIPTPPPVPIEIARALEYVRSLPADSHLRVENQENYNQQRVGNQENYNQQRLGTQGAFNQQRLGAQGSINQRVGNQETIDQ